MLSRKFAAALIAVGVSFPYYKSVQQDNYVQQARCLQVAAQDAGFAAKGSKLLIFDGHKIDNKDPAVFARASKIAEDFRHPTQDMTKFATALRQGGYGATPKKLVELAEAAEKSIAEMSNYPGRGDSASWIADQQALREALKMLGYTTFQLLSEPIAQPVTTAQYSSRRLDHCIDENTSFPNRTPPEIKDLLSKDNYYDETNPEKLGRKFEIALAKADTASKAKQPRGWDDTLSSASLYGGMALVATNLAGSLLSSKKEKPIRPIRRSDAHAQPS